MTIDTSTDTHRPTDAFRDYLEGEIVHTMRRNRTFRRLRAAAMVLVSVGIGATATLASAQVRTNAQRDSLIEAARADALLASVSIELARAQLAEEQRLVDVGAKSTESLAAARLRVRELEAQIGIAALNIEEIEASSLPARDDLNAPLVKGKDFVKARLQLRAMVASDKLNLAEQERRANGRRMEVGLASVIADVNGLMAVLRTQGDFVVLAERLRSRDEFLKKGTPVEDLTRRIDRVQLQEDLRFSQQDLEVARIRLKLLSDRQKVGAATELDVLKAQVELKEAEIRLDQLAKRIRQMRM